MNQILKKKVLFKVMVDQLKKMKYIIYLKWKNQCVKYLFENKKGEKCKGSGFFCEIDFKFPIKYALFTNN